MVTSAEAIQSLDFFNENKFIGFTICEPPNSNLFLPCEFDSRLNIYSEGELYRVTNSDRYTNNIIPNSQDKTIRVKGQKGSYYYGTYYSNRKISFPVAFQNIPDWKFDAMFTNFNELRNTKVPLALILHEEPWKYYLVYFDGVQNFTHLSFTDENDNVYYNGDGNLSFTCYEPFARSTGKYLWPNNYEPNDNFMTGMDYTSFYLIDDEKYYKDWSIKLYKGKYGDNFKFDEISSVPIINNEGNGQRPKGIPVSNLGDLPVYPIIKIDFTNNLNSNEDVYWVRLVYCTKNKTSSPSHTDEKNIQLILERGKEYYIDNAKEAIYSVKNNTIKNMVASNSTDSNFGFIKINPNSYKDYITTYNNVSCFNLNYIKVQVGTGSIVGRNTIDIANVQNSDWIKIFYDYEYLR